MRTSFNNVKPCFTNNNQFACECKILNVLLVLSCQEAGLGQNLPKSVFSLTPMRKWRSASEFLSKPGVSGKIYMPCQYKSWNINNQFRINIVILNSLKLFHELNERYKYNLDIENQNHVKMTIMSKQIILDPV